MSNGGPSLALPPDLAQHVAAQAHSLAEKRAVVLGLTCSIYERLVAEEEKRFADPELAEARMRTLVRYAKHAADVFADELSRPKSD